MKYFALFFLIVTLNCVKAATADRSIIAYARNEDDLTKIAARHLPEVNIKYSGRVEEYKKDLMKWNPHIKDWDHVSANTPLYIDYPYTYFVSTDFAEPLNSLEFEEPSFKNSIFFTASLGLFSEKTDQNQTIKSMQNSPVSLGLATSYKIRPINQHFLASAYWSKLVASEIEGSVSNANTKLTLPAEIGANFYYQHTINYSSWALYGGADYESFSTYNTAQLQTGSALETRKNDLVYATAGVSKTFSFQSLKINSKLSWAKSISSKSSTGLASDEFKGSRALFYLNFSDHGPFSYHFLYKRHMLKGPTKLEVDRAGIGAGFSF